jgi:hypothetical protein
MYVQKSGKVVVVFMIICMVTSVFDVFSAFPIMGANGLWVCSTGYFILRSSMPVIYLISIMVLIDPSRDLRMRKTYSIIIVAPYLIIFIILLINPLLPNNLSVFYYDENLAYNRGYLIAVIYLVGAI